MTAEKIIADGVEHEVEIKPLTLICHTGEIDVQIPGRLEITPETTVQLARQTSQEEWDDCRANEDFLKLWKMVWGEVAPPASLSNCVIGMQHTFGLLYLIAQCCATGQQPFVRLPETYLHPRQQVGLADVFIYFSRKST